MKRALLLLLSAVLCAAAFAQSARQLIDEDLTRYACQLHHYESAYTETPAPRGYTPVYVSHFSRHGSRNFTGDTYKGQLKVFHRLDSLGLLTPEGLSLYHDIEALREAQVGKFGKLTARGEREHLEIAQRLCGRCPEIFSGRKEVLAVSSTVDRCRVSMRSFLAGLEGCVPDIVIDTLSNYVTNELVTRVRNGGRSPVYPPEDNSEAVLDSILHESMDVSRMESAFFTDASKARPFMKNGDAQRFFYGVMDGIGIAQCLDDDSFLGIYRHFTPEEYYNFWLAKNPSTTNSHGYSFENGEALRRCGQFELRDILLKADEALSEGSAKAGDFRFGHDGGALPLLYFLGLEHHEKTPRLREVSDLGWYSFQNIEMATNIQMVFYRNRRGKVIVKFLHNERETTIPALPTWRGPYYKWSKLRPYLYRLTDIDAG